MTIIVTTSNFVEISQSLASWGKIECGLSPITPTQKRNQAKVLFKRAVNCYFSARINDPNLAYAIKDLQTVVNMAEKHGFEY